MEIKRKRPQRTKRIKSKILEQKKEKVQTKITEKEIKERAI